MHLTTTWSTTMPPRPGAPPGAARSTGSRLLRIPVAYKILGANALLIVSVVVGAAAVAEWRHLDRGWTQVAVFAAAAVIGALATMPVHLRILHLALSPIAELERTAARVSRGDLAARVPSSVLADPGVERLTLVFNRLLDQVASDRERLRAVAVGAFGAQEAERARLARELQDEFAQRLASVLLRMRLARTAPEGETRERRFEEAREELVEATSALRRFALGLHPPALRELGIVAALRQHARRLAEGDVPAIEVAGPDLTGLLAPEHELALFRILQEALANAVRHADARTVRVEVDCRDGRVTALVEDDGRGFVLADAQADRPCLGLLGMQERALYASGTAVVESAPGAGTRVRVEIPAATGADALAWCASCAAVG